MPTAAKPLFRPEALRPKLSAFTVPSAAAAARIKLTHWTKLLGSKQAEAMKETELLSEFLSEVFIQLLGYTGPAGGAERYTLKREATVQVDGKFADAALGRFSTAGDEPETIAAVEGKGPRDPLDWPFAGRKLSAVDQALRYAVNLVCDWYLVTNLHEIRLYHKGHDQFTFERFETATLATDDAAFRRFVFLLGAERVVPAAGRCHLDDLLSESRRIGVDLTRDYYRDYADLRLKTFYRLRQCNSAVPPARVLAATQTILDRVLFIAFCEDRGLLPSESIARAYRHADPYNPRPIWDNFRALFRFVDEGNPAMNIERYNGGLFAPDELLDKLTVPDDLCKALDKLASYDYGAPTADDDEATDRPAKLIDVEILGHIFEQSITDLEQLRNALAGEPAGASRAASAPGGTAPSKRKREGAFYTPSFITRYIVAATLRPALDERFEAYRRRRREQAPAAVRKLLDDPDAYDAAVLKAAQKAALVDFWEGWQDDLATLRIVDPACGSGAFLIEAFEQLHAVYRQAQARLTALRGPKLFDVDKQILQSNLYGVDLNDEAVDICRLSLWIKTAQAGKVLTSLDHNIRAGNSVIADPMVHPRALDWRTAFPEVFAAGGFDVVIANPPYVRQEWISEYKPYLQTHYRAYDGAADLYVYFYELGMNLLRPGGRLCFIVTNKWMKAGYGEPLRRYFGESAWVESVVNFGHAKQIFEDADVFPSILVARKPTADAPPVTARVCDIPRDTLRIDDLSNQIKEEGFEMPREKLSAGAWTLEPPGVMALMEKIRRAGVPLKEFAGVELFRGVTTGLNKAFLIDSRERTAIVTADPKSAEIIKPYLRGEDVGRWVPEWDERWMIFARRGIDIDSYPAVKQHLLQLKEGLEPKPPNWVGDWKGRKQGPYRWFEIQDSTAYWQLFERPKIFYQEIQFHPAYALGKAGMYGNNKTSFIPVDDLYLLSVLNSPLMWWHNWRCLPHMKDEALAPVGFLMQNLPIARPTQEVRESAEVAVQRLLDIAGEQQTGRRDVLDWLRVEYAVDKPSQKLQDVSALTPDTLAAEVKKARGKKNPLTVAGLKALREEHGRSIVPLQTLAAEARTLERQVAELVNTAYGLTPEEVALMWKTAPPRMPGEGPN
jgi:type I restriction-modification system DNA methylase subunit